MDQEGLVEEFERLTGGGANRLVATAGVRVDRVEQCRAHALAGSGGAVEIGRPVVDGGTQAVGQVARGHPLGGAYRIQCHVLLFGADPVVDTPHLESFR